MSLSLPHRDFISLDIVMAFPMGTLNISTQSLMNNSVCFDAAYELLNSSIKISDSINTKTEPFNNKVYLKNWVPYSRFKKVEYNSSNVAILISMFNLYDVYFFFTPEIISAFSAYTLGTITPTWCYKYAICATLSYCGIKRLGYLNKIKRQKLELEAMISELTMPS